MKSQILEEHRNDFLISTDKSKLDIEFIHKHLSESTYWARQIPLAIVKKSIENSLCVGIYDGKKQVAFARAVTDFATFAWISDVFVIDAYKGKGLSKWMMECMINHPDLQGLRRWILATRDAHGLYAQYDFKPLNKPEMFMEIFVPNMYERQP